MKLSTLPAYFVRWTILFLLFPGALAQADSKVQRVSFAERSDGLGYVVRLHTTDAIPEGDVELDLLRRNVLQMTLRNAELASAFRKDDPAGPVRDYTVRQRRGRVELRFQMRNDVPVNVVFYPDGRSDDVLLALTYTEEGGVTGNTLATANEVPIEPLEEVELEPVEEVAVERVPPEAVEPATESSATGDAWRLDTIVIDAGHGGHDPGARANGVREKDIALGVALKLGQYIEERIDGVRVVYTRKDDRFIEIDERGKIANRAGGKLFISIHANSVGGPRARSAMGTETFFLGLHKTESARRVMEKENAVVQLEMNPEQYAAYHEEGLIMQTLAQSAFLEKSEQLAALIEQQFDTRADRKSRGVKQAGFYVLWSAAMPAVLVETGFLTHSQESKFLNSERGQDLIASAIFRAVRDYKALYEKGLNLD